MWYMSWKLGNLTDGRNRIGHIIQTSKMPKVFNATSRNSLETCSVERIFKRFGVVFDRWGDFFALSKQSSGCSGWSGNGRINSGKSGVAAASASSQMVIRSSGARPPNKVNASMRSLAMRFGSIALGTSVVSSFPTCTFAWVSPKDMQDICFVMLSSILMLDGDVKIFCYGLKMKVSEEILFTLIGDQNIDWILWQYREVLMLTLKVVEGKRTCGQTMLSIDLTTIGDMGWLEEWIRSLSIF